MFNLQQSFAAVKMWIRELKQHAEPDIVMAIAGNKSDLEELREIQYKGRHFSFHSIRLFSHSFCFVFCRHRVVVPITANTLQFHLFYCC